MPRFPAVLVVTALVLAGCSRQPAAVWVEEPWILEAPAGTNAMAGYGVLRNGTDDTVSVTGVDSPAFARAHLHESRIEDGNARMAPVDSLTLPPGGRAVMRPGGLHLMLMSPHDSLEVGDRVNVRFHSADGGTVVAEFPVRRGPPGAE